MNIGTSEFIFGLGGIFFGVIITWLFLRASLTTSNDINSEVRNLRKENEDLKIDLTRVSAEKEADEEKNRWLNLAEEKLREAFDSLASKALKSNSMQFLNQSKGQLEALHHIIKGDWNTQREEFKNIINPIEKDLENLDKQVKDMEKTREGAYQTLESHIRSLSTAHTELQTATIQLKQVLKSSTDRGRWGEVQLRRIAEMAGMVEHVDFNEQIATESGTGRPDMVVRLPNEGILPVDSKAPMSAYLESCDAESEDIRKAKLGEHAKALRNHVKILSQKSYWTQFESSPEFVAMLIPYESGLSAAFSTDPKLLDDALASKVIIVSPATLLALLKVVALGWLQLHISKNAQKIADQGKELYNRFRTFSGHFGDIGSKLNASVDSYNKAVGSMETRVLPSVNKLKELGAGTEELNDVDQIEIRPRTFSEIKGD